MNFFLPFLYRRRSISALLFSWSGMLFLLFFPCLAQSPFRMNGRVQGFFFSPNRVTRMLPLFFFFSSSPRARRQRAGAGSFFLPPPVNDVSSLSLEMDDSAPQATLGFFYGSAPLPFLPFLFRGGIRAVSPWFKKRPNRRVLYFPFSFSFLSPPP